MAGDWIPMRLDLCEDPAVLQMADILGESDEYVVGCLHRVWSWASRNCHDGTVTGVTKMSLSRAVKLPKVIDAMCSVGWLVEGKTTDGVSFVAFPKWENWLSKSAKSRIQNAMNQRIARETKKSQPAKQGQEPTESVTNLSRSDSDKTVTTGENSTGEKSSHYVSLSLLGIKHFEFLSENTVCPEWLAPEFCRWLAFRFSRDAVKVDEILQETWIKRLIERGKEKSLADIDFSISKQAKNLLHVENDFDKIAKAKLESAKNPQGRETRGDKARQLIEDIKNGRV
jgi:hypothetical protein